MKITVMLATLLLLAGSADAKSVHHMDIHHSSSDQKGFQNLDCKILIHHGWTETWHCNLTFTDRVMGFKQNPPIKD